MAKKAVKPRRARVLLPGALGALIETQLRTQLRTPAARIGALVRGLDHGGYWNRLAAPKILLGDHALIVTAFEGTEAGTAAPGTVLSRLARAREALKAALSPAPTASASVIPMRKAQT